MLQNRPIPKQCYELLRLLAESTSHTVPVAELPQELQAAAKVCREHDLIFWGWPPPGGSGHNHDPKKLVCGITPKGESRLAEWVLHATDDQESQATSPTGDRVARLDAIAHEFQTLPSRGDSPAGRLESAGRLLIAAIAAGAFSEPRYTAFRSMVRQRLEQKKVNGWISAWGEAVWWLRGKPDTPPDLDGTFGDDCVMIVKILDAESIRIAACGGHTPDSALPRWVPYDHERVKSYLGPEPNKYKGRLAKLAQHHPEIRRDANASERKHFNKQNVRYVYDIARIYELTEGCGE